jgi:tetratricopeptide (TPR) repeat protein
VKFAFPSSFGDPGLEGEPPDREQLAEEIHKLPPDEADELAARAWRLWMVPPRDVQGGRRFLEGRGGSPALYGAGLFALRMGDVAESRRLNERALEEADGDEELALAHLGLSRVALEESDAEATLEHALKAYEAAERLGEPMTQAPLHMNAQAARLAGDLDGAAQLFEQSLAVNRRVGDHGMVEVELHNLGLVHVRRGDFEAAERYLGDLHDDPLAAAALAYARGDKHGASAWLHRLESDLPTDDRADADWLRSRL